MKKSASKKPPKSPKKPKPPEKYPIGTTTTPGVRG